MISSDSPDPILDTKSDLSLPVALVGKDRFRPHTPVDWVVLLLIVCFALFFSALALQQHRTFQTNGLDLGNVDQALWNTAQGRFLQFTLMTPVQSRLALHVEPILLLFVPLYWLNLGGPEALLIIQAVVVAIGAWPIFQIAKYKFQGVTVIDLPWLLRSSVLLLVFPVAYLLLPTLESAMLYDFHAVTLASTFLLFAFWTLEREKNTLLIIFVLLAMACKEDMPLVVAMLGLYAGLVQRRWRLAGLTLGLSAIWFLTAFLVIQPLFSAGGNIQLDRYAWLGNNPPEMVKTVVTQPALILNHLWSEVDLPGYLTALFFPTAFLALFSPLTLLPMLPTLAVNLLSNNPFTWRLEDFHYGAPLAPFLIVSTIYGVKRISDWVGRASKPTDQPAIRPANSPVPTLIVSLILLLLIFTTTYHYFRGFTLLARPFEWPKLTGHHQQLAELLPTIPAETPLFTQSNLAPHLTHRPAIYSDFAYFTDPDFPAVPVDDILLDVTSFENIGGLHQFLRQTLLESGDYQPVTAQDGILHLRPLTTDQRPSISSSVPQSPTPNSQLSPPFYTFAQPSPPPDYQLTVDFGDLVRLHGYTLHFNRQEEVEVTVDLEPLQPLRDVQPVLYLLDGSTGQPVGATIDLQPTLVWFPPEQWPVGETIRVRFNTLPWYTRQTPAYRLALGVMGGDDAWNIGQRRKPVVRQSDLLATRLPADGTLLELARFEQVWEMPAGGPLTRQFLTPDPPNPLEANFDHQVRLLGYKTPQLKPVDDSQLLTLDLHWQAVVMPPALIRFVQLVGPDGLVYGQNDSVPDGGNYPTHLWRPGEIVVETVTLPVQADRPPGQYTLHLGFYHPDTGQRVSVLGDGDHIEITGPFLKAE
jgi:uncharacterized membrane protein